MTIRDIEKLPYNWNGHGEKSFSKELISKADNILQHLNYPLSVFPTMRNSIQLEYENEDGDVYFEVEVYEDKMEVYSIAKGKEHYYKLDSIDEINNILKHIIQD